MTYSVNYDIIFFRLYRDRGSLILHRYDISYNIDDKRRYSQAEYFITYFHDAFPVDRSHRPRASFDPTNAQLFPIKNFSAS